MAGDGVTEGTDNPSEEMSEAVIVSRDVPPPAASGGLLAAALLRQRPLPRLAGDGCVPLCRRNEGEPSRFLGVVDCGSLAPKQCGDSRLCGGRSWRAASRGRLGRAAGGGRLGWFYCSFSAR